MKKSTYEISKMDCPSEENLIRMKLNDIVEINQLEFDIANRQLVVIHEGADDQIEASILDLKLGGKKLRAEETVFTVTNEDQHQRKLLVAVLVINAAFFILEMLTGIFSKSMGLVADSLDMLADAFVYGISLLAVGGTVVKKKRIAKLAGYFQLALALVGFAEVLRRFIYAEALPNFTTMIVVSVVALIGNSICLVLLQKSKSKTEAHMKASMIFTSNDVIINTGVIVAGILVNSLHSGYPDLIIGSIVFALVVQGAIRILKLAK